MKQLRIDKPRVHMLLPITGLLVASPASQSHWRCDFTNKWYEFELSLEMVITSIGSASKEGNVNIVSVLMNMYKMGG